MIWQIPAVISAIFFGASNIINKKGLTKERALAFTAAGHILMAILTVPLFFILDLQPVTLWQLIIVIIKSFFVVLFFLFSAQALKQLDISEYSPLTNLSPIILLFLGFVFLGEKVTLVQLGGIFITVLGAYLLELSDGLPSPFRRIKDSKHIHHLFLALVFGAICATIDKYALSGVIETQEFFVYQRIFIALILLVASLFFYKGSKDLTKVYRERPCIVLVSALVFMLADYFYFMAVAVPSSIISLVITVKRSGTLIPTITGGEFFKEKNILRKSLACAVMVLGVYIIIR